MVMELQVHSAGHVSLLHLQPKPKFVHPVHKTVSPMSLLTVSTVQGALNDARAHVETLEGRLEEAEGYRGQADILKLQLQELEVGTVAGEC